MRLDPITRKRLRRFRQIKRGYYSFLILAALTIVSLFSDYVANHRAIVVSYQDELYFPTFKFYDMATFGQHDEYGFDDVEADYAALQRQFRAREGDGWVLMPLVPYEPDFSYDEPPPNPPDRRHWIGTDSQGRDVFARLLYGFRISIFFAISLIAVSEVIGTVIGSMQGFVGGRFDIFSQRFIEIWSTMPLLYVVILLATFFKPSFLLLLAIMALFEWIRMTYYMRTEIYREKTKEYCLAARSFGASRRRLIFRHLLPNCMTPLVTITPFAIVGAISRTDVARLPRLRSAGADGELGRDDRSGHGEPQPRQDLAEYRALYGDLRHAAAGHTDWRVHPRGLRPQTVRPLHLREATQ